MKKIVGLTNAITDIIIDVSNEEIEKLGIRKGFHNTKASISYQNFLEMIKDKEKKYVPGGSPANVIINCAKLGVESCLLGTVGNDYYGENYINYIKEKGVEPRINIENGESGFCYILITPDKEKTSIAKIGISGKFYFNPNQLKGIDIFHTSSYEFITNPEKTNEIIDYVKRIGAKLSFDLADPSVIIKERKGIEKIVEKTDILFATEEESEEIGKINPCPITLLKKGKRGAVLYSENLEKEIPIVDTKVTGTNGAGDAFAAGFLVSYMEGKEIIESANNASYIASLVCAKKESHL